VRTISELHLADRFLERYDQLEPNVAPLEELPAVRPEVSGLSLRAEGTTLVLLRGPYGCWSTLAAHSLPGLVTGFEHDRETASCIYSLSGLGLPAGTLVRPPFRAPHYSISEAALAGSASHNRPGEIALAHGGVLFLDELHEFSRPACQALVNVLRHGVDRGGFPARPRIVAAFAPPCICGYYHDRREKCRCTEEQVQRHEARLHAEWMPRFDHEVWL
jgi:magnesium chelatase family protein